MRGWPALKDCSGQRFVEGPLRRVTVAPPGQGICKDVLVPGQVATRKMSCCQHHAQTSSARRHRDGDWVHLVDIGNRGGIVRNDIHSSALQLR